MIYHKIPSRFHYLFLPIKLILRILDIFTLELWVITGEEILSKQKLTVIYTGSEKNKNFLIKLAFDNSYREDHIGKTWLWRVSKTVKERNHNCSLIVKEKAKPKSRVFGMRKCFYIPCWVQEQVDIPLDISNKSAKEDLRRVRRNRLEYEVTTEAHQFHNFYYNMYLPFIAHQHGNRAVLMRYDDMMQRLEMGMCELLLIKKENEYIAGQLLVYGESIPRLWSVGVKDGNPSYLKDRVIAATTYFSVYYLKEKGYKRVSLGLSRGFLRDGVLQYKKKWGPKIAHASKKGFLIKPLSKTAGIKGFFLNNPFIWRDKAKFNGVIFVESNHSFSKEDLGKIYKDYYVKGISKFFIYRFGEGDGRMGEIVPSEFSDRMTICSAESLF